MIEGQEGVSWEDWLALGRAVEESGLEGLFRSDHYSGSRDDPRGALDAWTQIAALAAHTSRIRLGTLVSPVTFRHPSLLAKAVVTADHVSGGRVELGIGTGWMEKEHTQYGFPFPELGVRLEMLEEQLEIIVRQWTEETLDFAGKHFSLDGLRSLPTPVQQPRPPVIVGGSARPRTARLAARFADEYNTLVATNDELKERRENVRRAADDAGRELVFSLMTGCIVGRDEAELNDRVRQRLERFGGGGSPEEFVRERRDRMVLGTVDEVVERLRELEELGVERIFVQHLVHEDVDMVRLLGEEVAPAVAEKTKGAP
jgi:F420-dependent oxidoreductase-like protein